METREDLNSILPFLPLVIRSSALFWPSQVVEALRLLSQGPDCSNVNSGESLFVALSDIRNSLSLSAEPLAPHAQEGYALFFDELITRAKSAKWFREVLPALANFLLKLPSLLESHYENADNWLNRDSNNVKIGLRLLGPQEAGIVFLSQELIGALLACAFFCLFPITDRRIEDLPMINFDHLFESLYASYSEKQENKIKCIVNYFERISASPPVGFVSFERKVLPLGKFHECISYPKSDFWNESKTPLCPLEVHDCGFIEDQSSGALEVDFANKYLGGGALHRGCVQEEIRFMINPELIAGMLFLPCMEDNEAVEIVGSERFSNYIGYASSFRFSGDHVDKRDIHSFGRRKTRIVAIDALCSPGMRQYKPNYLLREINKAFCGFLDQSKFDHYKRLCQDSKHQAVQCKLNYEDISHESANNFMLNEGPSASVDVEMHEAECTNEVAGEFSKGSCLLFHEDKIPIATGNWGCGAFGGDPEIKSIIQWLAASQALRPSILYYTFGISALQSLDKVSQWIRSHEWSVGDLWNMLVEYSQQRFNRETNVGFFTWLTPSLINCETATPNTPP
ncbi:poly(ADP-ribose) glycohydrolase 1-like [Euphorbia lathyris]|uniref:poly(ADP-ribose) glycohydrolase 1-like n=1 Tax=Euphorbia lathyris TaxID=212925 RepID=UPI0033141AE4